MDNLIQLQDLLLDDNFDGKVFEMEPMSAHTTYKIGGPASFFVYVNSSVYLKKTINACNEAKVNWTVVGRGSNLLVSDSGYKGIVIMLGRDFKEYSLNDNVYSVGAGVSLARLVNDAFRKANSGFEFAVGTPGTIGGAVKMNAGTKDDWIGSRVISVTLLKGGEVITKCADEIEWGYRHTSIGSDEIILFADFKVTPLKSQIEINELKANMDGILDRRRSVQPLNKPCCGSVFKNPEGLSAGKLIEDAGLKACKCGGAQVSKKHANFIINTGRATALDVVTLIKHIQKVVFETYQVKLMPEVRFLGFSEECSLWA